MIYIIRVSSDLWQSLNNVIVVKRQRKISEDLEIEEEEMTDGNDDECYLCDGILWKNYLSLIS